MACKPLTMPLLRQGKIIADVPYPWFGVLLIVVLIVLPLVFIPLMFAVNAYKRSSSGKPNRGVICDRAWSIQNVMFWKNKYRNGKLVK